MGSLIWKEELSVDKTIEKSLAVKFVSTAL